MNIQTATKTQANDAPNGMIRIFHEGTAFFVTECNPFDLMAQRGQEVKLLGSLDDLCENEADLRRSVLRSDLTGLVYLNILFDTPAEEIPWWQEAA